MIFHSIRDAPNPPRGVRFELEQPEPPYQRPSVSPPPLEPARDLPTRSTEVYERPPYQFPSRVAAEEVYGRPSYRFPLRVAAEEVYGRPSYQFPSRVAAEEVYGRPSEQHLSIDNHSVPAREDNRFTSVTNRHVAGPRGLYYSSLARSSRGNRSSAYVVFVGREIGVFDDWYVCLLCTEN